MPKDQQNSASFARLITSGNNRTNESSNFNKMQPPFDSEGVVNEEL